MAWRSRFLSIKLIEVEAMVMDPPKKDALHKAIEKAVDSCLPDKCARYGYTNRMYSIPQEMSNVKAISTILGKNLDFSYT